MGAQILYQLLSSCSYTLSQSSKLKSYKKFFCSPWGILKTIVANFADYKLKIEITENSHAGMSLPFDPEVAGRRLVGLALLQAICVRMKSHIP